MGVKPKRFSILFRTSVLLVVFICFAIGTAAICGQGKNRREAVRQTLSRLSASNALKVDRSPVHGAWENLGLYGGQITALEIDPSNPQTMFAASPGGDGLFMTMDGGDNWLPVVTGHEGGQLAGQATFRNSAVWSVKIAPSDPETVWAVHDLWAEKSTTGGFQWTHIDNRHMQATCANCGGIKDAARVCRSLAIDPSNAGRVYVGTGGPMRSNSRGAIYRTEDGGKSWTKTGYGKLHEFDGTVVDIDIHPHDPGMIWAIADSASDRNQRAGLYLSRDYGKKWVPVFKGNTRFYDLASWPIDPNIVFVATARGILSNIASKFQYISGLTGVFRSLTFDPQDPYVLYTAGNRGIGRGVYHPDKKTFVFDRLSDVGLEINALAAHPQMRYIMGGTIYDGVFKASYEPDLDRFQVTAQNNGINARRVYDIDVISVPEAQFDPIIAATNSGIQMRVTDQNWKSILIPNLPGRAVYSVAFVDSRQSPEAFYAGGRGYLALTENGGQDWKFINRDLPQDMRVSDIAVAKDGATVFIATRRATGGGGSVYKSINAGKNLKKVLWGYNYDFNTVAINPSDSKHILAGSGNFYGTTETGRLYQSYDGGETWHANGLKNAVINTLLIDSENPQTIFAGCGSQLGTPTPLFKSIDGGRNWKPSYKGIPGRPVRYGIWGSAADDVFALGHTGSIVKDGYNDQRILHFDGRQWSDQMDMIPPQPLRAIWGSSSREVFAVGDRGLSVRYDGKRWLAMEPAGKRTTWQRLNAVWGRSPSEVYAVGDFGTALRYDGQRWEVMPTNSDSHLYGVWGDAGCNHLFAVGATGTILVYFNNQWHRMAAVTKAQLTAIWGVPHGKDIFTVGAPHADRQGIIRYTILRYDGKRWSLMDTPMVTPGQGKLHSVWGTSGTDVFAVGANGVILHFNGQTWTLMVDPATSPSQTPLGINADLYSVWGLSSKQVYAAGNYGTILNYDGNNWNNVDTLSSGKPVERPTPSNAVIGLKLKNDNRGNRIIYASTAHRGIYRSWDHGYTWRYLASPPYPIFGLDIGSVIVATWGVHAFQGQGLIVGWVKDGLTKAGLPNGYVWSASGASPTEATGFYQIPLGAGNYDLKGEAPGYKHEWVHGVPALIDGNEVTFFLSDIAVYIKINGTPLQAANKIFANAFGRIAAEQGDYESADGVDYLKLPYPDGWVNLVVSAQAGFQIDDLHLDGVSMGPKSKVKLFNLTDAHHFDVKIGAVSSGCPADYDKDKDVDGQDLRAFVGGLTSIAANSMAASFGKVNCLQP